MTLWSVWSMGLLSMGLRFCFMGFGAGWFG